MGIPPSALVGNRSGCTVVVLRSLRAIYALANGGNERLVLSEAQFTQGLLPKQRNDPTADVRR